MSDIPAEPGTGVAIPKTDMRLSQNTAGHLALMPKSLDEIWRIAQMMALSKLVPKDYRDDPYSVAMAIGWGMEIGLSAMQSVQGIAIINGRASVWGDTMVAVMLNHPEYAGHIETLQRDEKGAVLGATCEVRRKRGERVDIITRDFTMADAQRAGLMVKDTYKNFPGRMLSARARSYAIRDTFADALRGMGSADELIDVTPERGPESTRVVATFEPIRQPQRKTQQPEAFQVSAVSDEPEAGRPPTDEQMLEAAMAFGEADHEITAAVDEAIARGDAVHIEIQSEPETEAATVARTAPGPSQATLIPPAPAAKPATDAAPSKITAGSLNVLMRAIAKKSRTTSWKDLIDELGGEPTAATFARALTWIETRPDA